VSGREKRWIKTKEDEGPGKTSPRTGKEVVSGEKRGRSNKRGKDRFLDLDKTWGKKSKGGKTLDRKKGGGGKGKQFGKRKEVGGSDAAEKIPAL